MLFLADESCDALIVRTLRGLEHDVTYVAEFASGEEDNAILKLALDQRLRLTYPRPWIIVLPS
jgi:hypothetical protein